MIFHCQTCSKEIEALSSFCGDLVNCPFCDSEVRVPDKDVSEVFSPATLPDNADASSDDSETFESYRKQVLNLEPEEQEVTCPKCKSTQITAQTKGYGWGKGAIGGLLAGPLGLFTGGVGSKKILVTCLNCGHAWNAGCHK